MLALSAIEALIDGLLPRTAHRRVWWWSPPKAAHVRAWRRAGRQVQLDTFWGIDPVVTFVRLPSGILADGDNSL